MDHPGGQSYVPLSPISFIERAANVNGDKVSIVYGTNKRYTWKETYQRCLKLASALVQLKISPGEIVAALAPNIPEVYELHFGVPMAGAVLSALNINLDEQMLGMILDQLQPSLIFVDYQHTELVFKALKIINPSDKQPLLVLIPQSDLPSNSSPSITLDYNQILNMGTPHFVKIQPNNEFDPISINYTSGSTGIPKGAMYSHRATFLNSIAQISRFNMRPEPNLVMLWTVEMFRCNGWCLPWAMAALGGTNICLRNFSGKFILDSILQHKVTHIFGPPSILIAISNDAPKVKEWKLPFKVNAIIAGVMPNLQVLNKVEELGFNIYYAYGMTEVLGPVLVRPWKLLENTVSINELDFLEVDVKHVDTMISIPNDGTTIGEIVFRGSTIMLGYLKNAELSKKSFIDGWYQTGDLGIKHVDGRIHIKDRARDAIFLTGGEIISTLEIESVLLSHPKVLEAAVVGKYDDELKDEGPCAFVKIKEENNMSVGKEEIIRFCENELPSYMVPRKIIFGELPRNSTGKVQKFILREKANSKV
ncbi:hypothetical protein ACFE04_026514 [Oxalis oulophora]